MSTALAALRRIVAHVEATDNYMPGWRAWLGTLHEHAAELAEHPDHTLLILEREPAEGGGVTERVRVVVKSRAGDHTRVWELDGA